jgi:hypothetical protein
MPITAVTPTIRPQGIDLGNIQKTQQGAWWLYLAALGCPTLRIRVRDSESASLVFAKYRDSYGLGASDMEPNSGSVYDSGGALVARISYNGRVWNGRGELMHEASGV